MTPEVAPTITFEKISDHIISHLDSGNYITDFVKLRYNGSNGQLWRGDSLVWLKSIPANTIDLVFADPPYNIKKAHWDKFHSSYAYIEWCLEWIAEVHRILKPSGTFYICGFSEIVAEMVSPSMQYFKGIKWLIWHYKNKANLGKDWGRSHESILHFRKSSEFTFNVDSVRTPYHSHTLKYPERTQAVSSQYANNGDLRSWLPHPAGSKAKDVIEIPTTCNGMHEKTPHPTQKPEELLRKLILASTNIGDIVLDPFVGSGTTAVCAEQLQRKWLGCDMEPTYLDWAVMRLKQVEHKPVEYWIELDRKTQKRRMSIR